MANVSPSSPQARPPRRTAPHQPRLDWQMWFAALGHYQHNPWLLHLLYKIVASPNPRDDPALALLDLDAYPFDDVRRPALVRASLYHYDFTRVPSPWARALPGAALLDAACNPFRTANDSKCDAYWARTFVREYVPAVDAAVLKDQVVSKQGWPTDPPPTRAPSLATTLRNKVGFYAKRKGSSPAFVDAPAALILAAALLPAAAAALPRLDLAQLRPRRRRAPRTRAKVD